MEAKQIIVVRWGERVYGPFADYGDGLNFIKRYGRDAAEKRKAHVCFVESPHVLD